ncbi:MAG TPA: 3-hydroxyacyl-CoA dehydrogenase NAD-binding domain-containing protein [Kofleriaceae bacterium]|nr:3-hydroxyacyl-CoA dehydrogenase NAD-binding domain-containing protein [Kofleriaceae bacterium]
MIGKVVVIGGGQMGRGIAQVAAQAGLAATIVDANATLAEAAVQKIGSALDRLVAKEKISAADAAAAKAKVAPGSALEDASDADMIVEAAPENEALKLDLFARLGKIAAPHAILASNTSSISITKIAAASGCPERVIGMHFMNPVPVMRLCEIIRGLQTSDEVYQATLALAAKLGKTTITSRDVPGFIVNRILIPLLNEACFALYEGLGSAEDIDTGVTLGLNHPLGPLALADLVGLDTCLAIAEVLHRELGEDKYRPCPLLRQYVDAGWLGRKSGRGFYTYESR